MPCAQDFAEDMVESAAKILAADSCAHMHRWNCPVERHQQGLASRKADKLCFTLAEETEARSAI